MKFYQMKSTLSATHQVNVLVLAAIETRKAEKSRNKFQHTPNLVLMSIKKLQMLQYSQNTLLITWRSFSGRVEFFSD